jgi:hypothetical protein
MEIFLLLLLSLGMEPRASHKLSKCSIIELYLQPHNCMQFFIFFETRYMNPKLNSNSSSFFLSLPCAGIPGVPHHAQLPEDFIYFILF